MGLGELQRDGEAGGNHHERGKVIIEWESEQGRICSSENGQNFLNFVPLFQRSNDVTTILDAVFF